VVEDKVECLMPFAKQRDPLTALLHRVLRKVKSRARVRDADRAPPQGIVNVVVVPKIVETGVRATILPVGERNETASVHSAASWQKHNIGRRVQSVSSSARHRTTHQSAKQHHTADLFCSVTHECPAVGSADRQS